MKFDYFKTPTFSKELKRLEKKYPSIKNDILNIQSQIENKTIPIIDLGNNLKKIKLKITSNNKGKSGGARMVYQEMIIDIENTDITLVTIWEKSEMDNLDIDYLKSII